MSGLEIVLTSVISLVLGWFGLGKVVGLAKGVVIKWIADLIEAQWNKLVDELKNQQPQAEAQAVTLDEDTIQRIASAVVEAVANKK